VNFHSGVVCAWIDRLLRVGGCSVCQRDDGVAVVRVVVGKRCYWTGE
jgi:hypothetical protein